MGVHDSDQLLDDTIFWVIIQEISQTALWIDMTQCGMIGLVARIIPMCSEVKYSK